MKVTDPLSLIREVCCELYPPLGSIVKFNSETTSSTWNTGITTGKAIEMLVFCSILRFAESNCEKIEIPVVFFDNPDLFYLRNRFPQHYRSQAGHSITTGTTISLQDRFIASITPKALLHTRSGRVLCVYREGYPLHYIKSCILGIGSYEDRPDFIIAEEECSISLDTDSQLQFQYKVAGKMVSGCVRIKNDIKLPIIWCDAFDEVKLNVVSIVEASVGKSKYIAEKQLARYQSVIPEAKGAVCLLVNGQNTVSELYDYEISIDLVDLQTRDALFLPFADKMPSYTKAYLSQILKDM